MRETFPKNGDNPIYPESPAVVPPDSLPPDAPIARSEHMRPSSKGDGGFTRPARAAGITILTAGLSVPSLESAVPTVSDTVSHNVQTTAGDISQPDLADVPTSQANESPAGEQPGTSQSSSVPQEKSPTTNTPDPEEEISPAPAGGGGGTKNPPGLPPVPASEPPEENPNL